MPSRQSEAVRDYWRSATEAARKNPNQTPEEVRERVEKYWPALTAEPGGLDYLEVEVAGLPALWAVPKGAAEDRVILSVHGGGGVSGSIYKEVVEALASLYLAGTDPQDPLASPLYANLSGLPSTCIQVGGDETLLGESLQLEQNARNAGVDIQAEVFPGQQHTFQMAAGYAPESDDAIRKLARWVRPKLGLTQPQTTGG
jgi:acetyl esterase/lipase